ncbi:MAG: HAD family hydrolase [Chloroflexota bacterium]|nr:HAD family hydrolase [Chloroflexota bacterium]
MKVIELSALVQKKKAILFDLFHTLIALELVPSGRPVTSDLLNVSHRSWSTQLFENSRDRLVGKKRDPTSMVREMAHAIDPTISEEIIQIAARNRVERFAEALQSVSEDTLQVLCKLRALRKKVGLVSNADVSEIAAWDRSPIAPMFDSTIFSCRVGYAKPEPDIYLKCIQELGVIPKQCVFVGDGASHELEGARDLGITTVMVTSMIQHIESDEILKRRQHADYVIVQLQELVTNRL